MENSLDQLINQLCSSSTPQENLITQALERLKKLNQ